jgi:dipeptide/tripeptide permease
MNQNADAQPTPTLFGHPAGLFTLFFAEMWERFSYYGMRAILLFYMIKGFLGYGDRDAYAVYAAYTALVYMTPFFGGMLADRLLGPRRAVIFGAILMASGQFLLTISSELTFFTGLGLLICGNGFFKPNISTIIGALYPQGSTKRDSGFTIFYMGINLGAAMSPLLCGYIGETYGWSYGFGLATIGMLTGLTVFVNWLPVGDAGAPPDRERLRRRPVFITQFVLVTGAIVAAAALFLFHPDNFFSTAFNVFVGVALLVAAGVACAALRGGVGNLVNVEWAIYLGTLVSVPAFVLLVSGFSQFTANHRPVALIPAAVVEDLGGGAAMHARWAEVQKAVQSQSQHSVERLTKALDCMRADLTARTGHYAALQEAAALATQEKWESAKATAAELEQRYAAIQDPDLRDEMQAELGRFRPAVESEKSKAVSRFTARLAARIAKDEAEGRQFAALADVVGLARAGQWERAQRETDILGPRFPARRLQASLAVVLKEVSRPAGLILFLSGLVAFGYLGFATVRLDQVPRQRMYVVLILTFFSMLFWAFFEQAGSSVNNFTDRNVSRVFGKRLVTADEVGQTRPIQPTQEQLGYKNGDQMFTLDVLDQLRREHEKEPAFVINWTITEDNVGMGIAERSREVPASTFQAVNPIYILIFGLVFTALWATLAKYGLEPSTPVKFALGLLQLGLGFGVFWYAAKTADARGMAGVWCLVVGYLLHTTGELCLSPVGLSMITRLSPAVLVSTVMGAWFLATAFSQFLAGIFAQFTSVENTWGRCEAGIPIPKETVDIYGNVFGKIAVAAIISAVICFLLAPLLRRWMHAEVTVKS